ncbi:MAG: winged helix-turn-helix domain-containing protein [Candidatus Methanoperedens sp.]|nr:winged helix-turn-helix domain-containing protein [Candidatus Methanoperedens sp.]MCE8427196.1 winged helix-turn-helix domain-containing protein [Candidatus Methanoperedens sp.]
MTKIVNSSDIIRLAVCSDLRKDIILCLFESQKSLGDLRDNLKISSTTAIHALKELEKGNLTFQEKNKNYGLTNIGRVIAIKLLDFCNAAEVSKKYERFWLEHDLSGIPQDQMEKIGWLKNSNVAEISSLDIVKTHSYYVNSVKNAKWIKGVSPIFSSDYTKVYKELAEKNLSIQLILSEAVLNKLIEAMGTDNLKCFIDNSRVEIFVTGENIKVAFTVTDAFLSLGLFNNNGVYDITHDLTSTDYMAVRWGDELFEYYQEKSKKYKS